VDVSAPIPASSDLRHAGWPALLLVSLFSVVTSVGSFYFTLYFRNDLGFSGTEIGILFAVQAVTGLLAAVPTGIGNDRVTSRTLVAVGLVGQGLGLALLAVVDSFPAVLAVFFLGMLSSAVFKLSLDVQVLKRGKGDQMPAQIGSYQGARFFGLAGGAVVAGYLLAKLDFVPTFLAAGVACLALLPLTVKLLPTPLSRARLADYRADYARPRVLLFCLWLVLFATHWGAEFTCYSLFLQDNLGLTITQMGWYMSGEFAAIVITTIVLGYPLRRKADGQAVFALGLIASGAGHIGMVVDDVLASALFRVLHGCGDGAMFMVFYVGIFRIFSLERMGGNFGVVNMMTMAGMVVGSVIYGTLGANVGYEVPMWVSGAVTLALAAPVLMSRPAAEPLVVPETMP
jgi:predicted MFS family arabinose efflux permease